MDWKEPQAAGAGTQEPAAGGRTLKEIMDLLTGEVVAVDERLEEVVHVAGASDLMSDVLAFMKPGSVLLTGLKNPQVVRTAEMADISAIIFVRGRHPEPETVNLAHAKDIPLIKTPLTMFEACGRLFAAGLKPCF